MQGSLADARGSLRGLYSASAASASGRDVSEGAGDGVLQLYMKAKSDTRALLTYYRDAAAHAAIRPTLNVAASSSGKSSSKRNAPGSSSTTADDLLVTFEHKFDLRDELPGMGGGGGGGGQQRDELFLLRQISELNSLRDNTIYKLVNFFLEQLGIEHIESERKHLPPNLASCSKELPMLFHF